MAQSSSPSSSMAKTVSYDKLQPHVGWYGTLGGSGIQPRDTDGTVNGTDSTLEYNMGYGLFGAGGYRFRNGLRLEGEIGYGRSEEHTSELPSLMRISYACFCLKQKQTKT